MQHNDSIEIKERKPLITTNATTSPDSIARRDHETPSFETIDDLCDFVQSIVSNHLSIIDPTSTAHKPYQDPDTYSTINQHIVGLKNELLKLHKKRSHGSPITTDTKSASVPTQTTRLHSVREVTKMMTLREDPKYAIDSDQYCLCQGSVRQDWNTIELDENERNWKELKPSFFELFFDLMFVASIVHISDEAVHVYDSDEGSFWFFLQVLAQFGIFVLCWLEQVFYQSRFRMSQSIDHLLKFIYMALVLTMGTWGISDNEISHKFFLVSYLCLKFVLLLMLCKSALIPRARNHSLFMISEKIISIVATVLMLALVHDVSHTIWLIIFGSLFVYSYLHITVAVYCDCIRYLGVNIPINVPHFSERMGAFVLILLGETIISIMLQGSYSSVDDLVRSYFDTMGLFLIVWCIGKLYFGSQPSEHEVMNIAQCHALSSNKVWRARVYTPAHFMLFFSLLGLGIGSKMITHHLSDWSMEMVFLPGVSCIAALIIINIIRLTHRFNYDEYSKWLVYAVWSIRVLSIGLMYGILFAWTVLPHYVILIIYVVVLFIQLIIDFESRHRANYHPLNHDGI